MNARPRLGAALVIACLAAAQAVQAQPARMSDDEILRKLDAELSEADKARREGRGPKHPELPPQDPCGLLTAAEIKAVLGAAGAGQRDDFNEQDGISRCVWRSAGGAPVLVVELVAVRAGRSAPGIEDAAGRVPPGGQMRKLAIGDGAVGVYVPRDPKAGLHRDLASVAARRGKVDVKATSDELARRGADSALTALEQLVRKAVARL